MPDTPHVFSTSPDERLRAFFERLAEPRPLRARTKAEWIERRKELRPLVWEALGLEPAPDRIPLEIRAGEAVAGEGYTVEPLHWQVWPQVWASGRLYRHGEPEGKGAALLCPVEEAGSDPPTVAALAQLGYVVLAVDPWDVREPAAGLSGLTAATWTHLRALDLLAARPDVDRERIGLWGRGAGAVAALLVLALDDRPEAAVLEDCPAELPEAPGLAQVTSLAELCALPSPRALQFLSPEPGLDLGELLAIYRLWQQPDRLDCRPSGSPRELREAAYTWLERELRGNRRTDPVSEPPTAAPPAPVPGASPEGDRGEEGIREWFRKRVVAQPPQLESRQSRRNYQDRVRAEVRELLGKPRPASLDPRVGEGHVSFRSEVDVRVPAAWLPGSSDPFPVLVAAHPEGKAAALRLPLVRRFREAGWGVLAPDLRLRGEMRPAGPPEREAWGRPEAGMAVDDLLACVQWLWQQPAVEHRTLVLLGAGDQGVPALLAAGLDERVAGVIADCGGTTYRDGGAGLPVIPNILRVADVPQLASLAAPRPLWLYHVPPERVGFSSRRYYDWTRRSFQSLGNEDALKMTPAPEPEGGPVLDWLQPRLKKQSRKG